jgi:UPF0716 protein FxsA
MVWRLFLGYLVVELAVIVALTATIGLSRTLLVLLATFVVGAVVVGSQLKRQLARLRTRSLTARGALADTASVALATVLIIVPGLVTSALGLLLLFPLTRPVVRPVLIAVAARGTGWPLITAAAAGASRYAASRSGRRGEYVDGEVVDVVDAVDVAEVDSPVLPPAPPEQSGQSPA